MNRHTLRRAWLRAVSAIATVAAIGGLAAACSTERVDVKAWEHPDFSKTGPITYVQGKDNSGKLRDFITSWNKEHPNEKVTMIELSTEADQQRNSFVQNAQTKSDSYCVESLDNIWVAEFAANRWVVPLPMDELKNPDILPPVWQTGLYRDKLYAMPHASDGAVLFYRSDLLKQAGITEPPVTWADMKTDCDKVRALPGHEKIGCYASQEAKYEGLTVNTVSAINSAGGEVIDSNGKVVINSPEAKKGFSMLVEGMKSGFIPKEAMTYKEEEGRSAFEKDRVLFYANWPYMYSLSEKAIPGKFGVTSLPQIVPGKAAVSSLGGHNVGISTYCENKGTALKFIKAYSSKETVQWALDTMTLAPTYKSLYEDPANIKKFPYLPALLTSIENAKPRPKVVNYADISSTIQDQAFDALQGKQSADAALDNLAKLIDERAMR
ncbi:MAG: ABC transporter substrate-binding protein [Actinomycetaceae bacterium]|nr:ABC transporter substrate-binding protein [Actinomycetaceae bacterium]MDU0969836.1 ABC transporter substrate-binding protein [Actinomycetaceae bacterium]